MSTSDFTSSQNTKSFTMGLRKSKCMFPTIVLAKPAVECTRKKCGNRARTVPCSDWYAVARRAARPRRLDDLLTCVDEMFGHAGKY